MCNQPPSSPAVFSFIDSTFTVANQNILGFRADLTWSEVPGPDLVFIQAQEASSVRQHLEYAATREMFSYSAQS